MDTKKVLLDHRGLPIQRKVLTQELAAPTVTGVRQHQSGHPAQGLTPQRLATILREAEAGDGTRYLELAEEMEEKDLHYHGVLGSRKRQVSQLEITVEAASTDQADEEDAQMIRDWLRRDDIEDELFDILDAIGKGYSVCEIMWSTDDGMWMPRQLLYRDPRFFRFDPADGTTLRLIGESGELLPMAPYKYIQHQTKAKSGSPIRGGLARVAAWAYLFKNFTVRDWVIFAERYGHPLRVGKFRSGATQEEKDILLSAVSDIASDAAAIIPEGMEIEFIEAKLSGNLDLFERHADWIDRQVSKAVLGQTLTTEIKGGSLAGAKVHEGVKDDIERADAKSVSATLNRDLVIPIISLNKGPRKRYPKIRVGRPDETNVALMITGVEAGAKMGLKVSAKDYRDKIGAREPEDEDDVLQMPTAATPPPPKDIQQEAKAMAAAVDAAEADKVEQFIAALASGGDFDDAFEPLLKPLEEALNGAETFEEMQAVLATAMDDMDTTKLAELLARGMFQSHIEGDAGADPQDAD